MKLAGRSCETGAARSPQYSPEGRPARGGAHPKQDRRRRGAVVGSRAGEDG